MKSNNIKYIKSVAVVLGLMLSCIILWNCAKDKGNYDYNPINTLQISTDLTGTDPNVFITADSINVKQNDSLRIALKIENSTAQSTDLTYNWYLTQYETSVANPPTYQIGSNAVLRTKITYPPNLYKIVAKVTDKSSGVSFYKSFSLNVTLAEWGDEGWVVLQETADGSDISVITTRDGSVKGKAFHSLYSSVNGHKLPIGTHTVNVVNYATSLRAQKVSFFYPNGGMQVRSVDFADSTKAEDWFFGSSGNTNFQLNGSAGGSAAGWEYVVTNNKIAYRQLQSAAHLANPPFFFPPYEGLTVAPFVVNAAASDHFYTLYDISTRGFALFNASTSTLINIPNYTQPVSNLHPTTGQGFDLKNMQDNLIHAENVQSMNMSLGIYWNFFFRNNANTNTYLVQFPRGIAYANNFTTGRFQLTEASCPGINSATLFANPTFMPMPRGVFYYVSDNKVYTVNVNTLASSKATANLTFPAGTIIKAMKVFNSGYTTGNNTALNVPDGKVLVIATDEMASGKGHNVYFFNLDTQSGTIKGSVDNPADKYSGFDKITTIAFKKALGR